MQEVNPLDLGFAPEAAVSGPLVLQYDGKLILSFNAVDTSVTPHPDLGRAVIEFDRPLVSKFGYPNDEALEGHPLNAAGLDLYGYGGFEVLNSAWKDEIDQQNRVAFPDWRGYDVRHFAFVFHDSMFECLARNYVVVSANGPDERFFEQALREM